MTLETLYLTGAVLAFTLLAVTLLIVKLWSDAAPAVAAEAEVTPARRPVTDPEELKKAA
ncbi:hypothetical protein [Phenylobacterium sp.]|jgi:hypothetical protein|uniref:hypothetical protein n=1 Tax=Phenylobacterium sp. TaxID=1871053 RepID=UPI002E3097F5|nr:hypothetical protein [Phenylobacterium sp.]HEX2561550.1 hypothetical protein [Phenylobacterium sp.]